MKIAHGLSALTLALALAACGGDAGNNAMGSTNSSAAAVAAPAGTAWADTKSKTEAGGFVMGNPGAAVKLIEYGALSCSHCADFSRESSEKLQGYINKGTVSYEFRPFLLNSFDLPAFLLARCGGPGPFFALAEQMFAAQPDFFAKAQAMSPADQQRLGGLPPQQLAPALATAFGFDSFVQQRGISSSQAQACLTDQAAVNELNTIMQSGNEQFQITGTPTFIVNGDKQNVTTWDALEPLLVAAGA